MAFLIFEETQEQGGEFSCRYPGIPTNSIICGESVILENSCVPNACKKIIFNIFNSFYTDLCLEITARTLRKTNRELK